MKVDIGEALTYAWQVSWKHKTLWWYGIFMGLIGFAMFPLFFLPMFAPFLMENQRPELLFFFMLGFFVLFFGFFALLFPVSAVVQSAVTVGIIEADQGAEQISLVESLKKSLAFFWRVIGVMVLYTIAVTLFNVLIQVVMTVITVATFGFGMFCMMPLMFLLYPVMFLAVIWMEQSINGVIIDDLALVDAVRQGWQIVRNNLLTIAVLVVVLYFGVNMVVTIFMMPLMLPFMALPFSLVEGEVNWTIISVSLLCGAAFIPLIALVSGWALAFTKSVWVFTYLRLTRPSNEPQPILQESPA